MTVSTLIRGLAFVAGVCTWAVNAGSEGSMLRMGSNLLGIILLAARAIHAIFGMGAIIDDYIHDGFSATFLKLCTMVRTVATAVACYNRGMVEIGDLETLTLN